MLKTSKNKLKNKYKKLTKQLKNKTRKLINKYGGFSFTKPAFFKKRKTIKSQPYEKLNNKTNYPKISSDELNVMIQNFEKTTNTLYFILRFSTNANAHVITWFIMEDVGKVIMDHIQIKDEHFTELINNYEKKIEYLQRNIKNVNKKNITKIKIQELTINNNELIFKK